MPSIVPSWLRVPTSVPLLQRTRHVWAGDDRLHVELRDLDDEQLECFASRVVIALERVPGVRWAEVNAAMHRVVVACTDGEPGRAVIVRTVEDVEMGLGVDELAFRSDLPDHPGDDEAVLRQVLTLGGDLTGFGIGLVRAALRVPPIAATTDLAALIGVAQNVPSFRRPVERRFGWPLADVGLEIADAVISGIAQGPLGPFVDLVQRSATLAETLARRRAWQAAEPELCGAPRARDAGLVGRTPPVGPRPGPLPAGPIERYAERAWPVSVGAFAVALPVTRSLERATAALSAGLPKAARLGRESFAVQLGLGLASRGMITLDTRPLRLLDRIDTVVVEADVLDADEGLATAIERAQLDLLVIGQPTASTAGLGPHKVVRGGKRLATDIRQRQGRGHVVLVIATTEASALAAADCAVGVRTAAAAPPWSVHLLCRPASNEATLIVDACAAARDVSRQSATIALGGASVGGLMAFGGLLPGRGLRVTTAVNLASLVAVTNGARAGLAIVNQRQPTPRDPTPWHELDVDEVLQRLRTSRQGLDAVQAEQRRTEPPRPEPGVVRVARAVGEELVNPLTPILAVGAGLSVAVGSVMDAGMVAGVVGMNALVGGVQRYRADQAIEALSAISSQRVLVRRHGHEVRIVATDLVPGDVVRLEAGEAVPADCRILSATSVEVDESSLTGESLPVVKAPAGVSAASVADRASMLYDGTSVAAGSCWAIVVAVGRTTEARRALDVGRTRAQSDGVEARLRSLTDLTVPVAAGAGVAVIALGLLRGRSLVEVASAGVSLTVAAVPEGLPLLATVAQLAAARRLSANNVLVRNPRAIEALGRVDVLCADKTGTLTEGRIRVGRVSDGIDEIDLDKLAASASGRQVLAAAVRATPRQGQARRLPHPTDRAVLHAAEKLQATEEANDLQWEREALLDFEPGRGFHAVLARCGGRRVLSVKGAPEVVLAACSSWAHPSGHVRRLDTRTRSQLADHVENLARAGYRVLVVAERDVPARFELSDTTVRALRLRGFLCLTDPVRPTASAAVGSIRRAGVSVVMITGDHPTTAEGIAAELGVLGDKRVVTGSDLDALSDGELDEVLGGVAVFARVTPAHKVRIVRAYQRAGRVVAMTGDGANDAPAIRLADVGIALGERSTPAAREAADLVVTNDRIETIVDAIVEGRGMWGSVREAVALLVGSNLGEIAFTLAGSLLSGAPPLSARQLLVVNLLTDVAPAMAVAMRQPRGVSPEALLREGPDASLGESLNQAIALRAGITGTTATVAWIAARLSGTPGRARTVGMAALVGTQLGQTLAVGGRDPMVLAAGVGSAMVLAGIIQTPGVSHLFGCQPLGPLGWSIATTAAAVGTAASAVAPRLLQGAALGLPSDG